jgi:hypothetical protein
MNTRVVKGMAAVAMVTALGVGVTLGFVGSPFGSGNGGTPPAGCGEDESCAAVSYEATAVAGSGFTCTAALASCLDPGPGALNDIGTNGSGDILLGSGNVTVRVGGDSGSIVMTGNGSLTNTNGAINCDSGCQIRDSGNGVLPVNTTGGVSFNGTSAMTGFTFLAATVDVGNITAQTCLDVTTTIAGVEANDGVYVTRNFASTANYAVSDAYVTNAGTDEVTFRACNGTGGDINPASGSYLFWVVRKAP